MRHTVLQLHIIQCPGATDNRHEHVGIGTAAAFTAEFGATFETFFDRDGRLTSAMGVATAPVTMLIDAGGVVRRQLTGEITSETLSTALREVFPS